MTEHRVVKDKHGLALSSTMGIVALVLAIITVGYLLPWAIAVLRGKSNGTAILLVNLLLGWTVVGWIIALVMACMPHQSYVVPK